MDDPMSGFFGAATDAISSTSGQAASVLENLAVLLGELQALIVVRRTLPRTDEELWDEEVETLKQLRVKRDELVTEFEAMGGDRYHLDDISTPEWVDAEKDNGNANAQTLSDLASQIISIESAINAILNSEPGEVLELIHSLQEILKRFQTLEQPRIESIMDASEDTIKETTEILTEIRKLFVKKGMSLKDPAKLTTEEKATLEVLHARKNIYHSLIDMHSKVASQISEKVLSIRPGLVQKTVSGTNISRAITSSSVFTAAGKMSGNKTVSLPATTVSSLSGSRIAHVDIPSRYIRTQDRAYIQGLTSIQGSLRYFEREHLKIEREIVRVAYEVNQDLGVIPGTLEDIHLSIERFHTVEQPKIERILDITADTITESKTVLTSVDATVNESRHLIVQLNTSLGKVQVWFDVLATYRVPLLICCALFGFLTLAIMVTVLIVLIKMALA